LIPSGPLPGYQAGILLLIGAITMLTRGNHKLGRRHIWGFTLPSGTDAICPGRTEVCSRFCYAKRLETLRPKAHKAYRRNLLQTYRRDFVRRVYHFLRAFRVRIVRIHVGGDFYSDEYARKWLRIIKSSSRTRFYFYTRSWRVPAIRIVLDQMAQQANCAAWFSCDQETGLPEKVPSNVRLAWLQVEKHEVVPDQVDLFFRRHGIRRQPLPLTESRVCPEQDGVVRSAHVTCEQCQLCIRQHGTIAAIAAGA